MLDLGSFVVQPEMVIFTPESHVLAVISFFTAKSDIFPAKEFMERYDDLLESRKNTFELSGINDPESPAAPL